MLAGSAVVAIWNNITPEGRDEFYAWHVNEHIPERVDIPGFRRGRRYAAAEPGTDPAFFTLYETDDVGVLTSPAYAARLNAPTPWTRKATGQFRNTARALALVLWSGGAGVGGALLTVRFDAGPGAREPLSRLVESTLSHPRVCGAHLCRADEDSSRERTAESRDRTDIEAPPSWFVLIEATDADALAPLLTDEDFRRSGAPGPRRRGAYRLEFLR